MFKILWNLFSWGKMKENIQGFSRANAKNNYFTRVVHKWHLQVQFIMRLVIIMSNANNFSIVNAERTFLNLMSVLYSFREKAFHAWNILTNVNWRILYISSLISLIKYWVFIKTLHFWGIGSKFSFFLKIVYRL